MAVKETYEFAFTCDECGEEYTMFTNELPEGWGAFVHNADINVERTDYYSAGRNICHTVREYKVKNAHITSILCPKCVNDIYNMFTISCH